MKKLLALLLASTSVFALPMCPCPGACCPKVDTRSLNDMASFLSPWATEENANAMMEKDLEKHRV